MRSENSANNAGWSARPPPFVNHTHFLFNVLELFHQGERERRAWGEFCEYAVMLRVNLIHTTRFSSDSRSQVDSITFENKRLSSLSRPQLDVDSFGEPSSDDDGMQQWERITQIDWIALNYFFTNNLTINSGSLFPSSEWSMWWISHLFQVRVHVVRECVQAASISNWERKFLNSFPLFIMLWG